MTSVCLDLIMSVPNQPNLFKEHLVMYLEEFYVNHVTENVNFSKNVVLQLPNCRKIFCLFSTPQTPSLATCLIPLRGRIKTIDNRM